MPGSFTVLQIQNDRKIKYSVEYHLNYVYFMYLNFIPLSTRGQNDMVGCQY